MTENFLLCRHCGTLFPLDFAFDEAVEPGEPSWELELRSFRQHHEGHPIVNASRVPDSVIHDRPAWDPMATAWFRVAIGNEELLVRSWRTSIEEPRRHDISTAPAPALDCSVEIDERLLRRALDEHFSPAEMRKLKLDRFVGSVQELLRRIDAAAVETSFDDVEVANAEIAPFPSPLCEALLSACQRIFNGGELAQAAAFIEENRFEDGALALRVRRDLRQSLAATA